MTCIYAWPYRMNTYMVMHRMTTYR